MKDTKVVIFTVFKMKILYILFIGVCCAAIIATAKYLFSDIANRHGDYLFIQTIQVENQVKDDFDYKGYLESRECKIVCVNRYCMNLLYAPYWGKQR